MKLLDGKLAASKLKEQLFVDVQKIISLGITPCIAIVWDDSVLANNTYVRQKVMLCEQLNIKTKLVSIKDYPTQSALIDLIKELNADKSVHGILIQLPLPVGINEHVILGVVDPSKDVDCFNFINIGNLWSAKQDGNFIKPCTPNGIIQLLKLNNISMEGKNVVIVNRSNIVGKPIAALFLLENATVTICHSKTKNLKDVCKNADILICGVGRTNFFNHEYIGKNAVVIDVSINRNSLGKLCGDVDMNNLQDFDGYLSPVPGGVGPMTVSMVIRNLINLILSQRSK